MTGPDRTDGPVAHRAVDVAGLAAVALEPSDPLVTPFLVVDLDGVPPVAEVVAAAARGAAAADAIVVGVATGGGPDPVLRPLLDALDLTVAQVAATPEVIEVPDPAATLATLRAAVAANPHAAAVLADLLRATATLPVPDALDVESYAYSMLLGGPEFAAWLASRGDRPPPSPAAREPVLVLRDGDVLRLTLNRPERRNAYGTEVRDALVDALRIALLDDSVTRVVLDGAGPSFCSGGDLGEFGTTPDPVTAHRVRTRGGAARPLHQLAARTEVRVHGSCVGAGIELAAFAGRIVAAEGTTFRLPEVSMGLIPGAGGTVSIPRRIGRWRTLYLALTGIGIDTTIARSWGLIDGV